MASKVIDTRLPKIGDYVTIHNFLCEWDGQSGEVVGMSASDPEMPYMVQRAPSLVWPFAIDELELHSEDAAYKGGWIDPYTVPLIAASISEGK